MRIYIAEFSIDSDKEGISPYVRVFVTWDGRAQLETNDLSLKPALLSVFPEHMLIDDLQVDGGRPIQLDFDPGEFLEVIQAIVNELLESK